MEFQAVFYTLTFIGYLVSGAIALVAADRWFRTLNARFRERWYPKYLIALADGWLHAVAFFLLVKVGSLGRSTEIVNSACVFAIFFLAGLVGRLLSFRLHPTHTQVIVPKKQFLLLAPGLLGGIVLCAVLKPA